jgi:hypothetical protein
MRFNQHKTVSASSKGIIISFSDANKHRFIPYECPVIEDIQLNGHTKYQQLESPVFNKIQQKLYGEAVYGLSYFSTDAVEQMSKGKKLRILAKYAKAQRILNSWKQEIVHAKVDSLFLKFFPKSPITKAFVEVKGYDRQSKECHSFKELGLTQENVANKLIEVNLLPNNFYELTT